MQLKNQIFSLVLLSGLSSCIDLAQLDSAELPAYEAEFALPLVHSRITIKDLLDSSAPMDALSVDPDGTLRFQYRGTEIRSDGAEVFAELSRNFPPAFPVLLPEMRYPISGFSDIVLDRLDFEDGQFVYYLENPNPEPVSVVLEFTTLQQAGAPLRVSTTLPAFSGVGSLPAATNSDQPIDLRDYRILPEDNALVLRYSAQNENGENRLLNNVVVQIQEPVFTYAEGYLGQFLVEGIQETIDLDLLEEGASSDIQFALPELVLEVENSFGLPSRAQVNEFTIQGADGTEQQLTSTVLTSGLNFAYPGLQEVGTVATGAFVFTADNSNIVDIFAKRPVGLRYDIDIQANPEGDESQVGFITDSSYYTMQIGLELPLVATASQYTLYDTLNFNVGDLGAVEQASFRIIAENEMGIDATVQAYFLDEQGAVLETLFTGQRLIAQGAVVDDSGLASASVATTSEVTVDADQLSRIQQATRMILEVGFSTASNAPRPVRILEQQGITVKIGALLTVTSN